MSADCIPICATCNAREYLRVDMRGQVVTDYVIPCICRVKPVVRKAEAKRDRGLSRDCQDCGMPCHYNAHRCTACGNVHFAERNRPRERERQRLRRQG